MAKNKKAFTNELGLIIESDNNYSYAKVAQHLGVPRQTVWTLCHNKPAGYLTIDWLNKIAKAMNYSPDELLKRIYGKEEI